MKAWQSYWSVIGLVFGLAATSSGCDTDERYDTPPAAGKAAGGSGGKSAEGGSGGGKAEAGKGGAGKGGSAGTKASAGKGGSAGSSEEEEDAGQS